MDKLSKAIEEAKVQTATKDFKAAAEDILASPINQVNLATTTIDQAMMAEKAEKEDEKKEKVAQVAKNILANFAKGFEKQLSGYKFEISMTLLNPTGKKK
jgi:hypothetical protein